MQRRVFLKALLAFVGMAATGSTVAHAEAIERVASHGRYAGLLERADRVIDISKKFWSAKRDGDLIEVGLLRGEASVLLDDLIEYSFEKFGTEIDPDQIFAMMGPKARSIELSEESLQTFVDGVVPVAIVKELFSRHRLVVDHTRMAYWKPFTERYQEYIL